MAVRWNAKRQILRVIFKLTHYPSLARHLAGAERRHMRYPTRTMVFVDPRECAQNLSDLIGDWPRVWCGRWESNPHGHKPNGFSYHFGFHRRPPPIIGKGRLWSGLSLHRAPANRRVGAARLVSTPSAMLSRYGLARDRHLTGFPEFEQFCIAGFLASTQSDLSPLRLPVPPRPQSRHGPNG